ncbi:MAG: single-stranded DNA-binding protein, partial [Clostridia bacterium]
MNKAIFIGNLARDPELKVMQNGKPRCTFTVAVSRPYTN